MTVNLAECIFTCGTITYLGHEIGSGKVRPVNAHIKVIKDFPRPQNSKDVMTFFGTVGYYRRFCKISLETASPLIDSLKKCVQFN